ncbi:DUF5983 family protein [Escherichia coli]|uniref:DUF5983 family protein n=2 Tax=Escherichia coli TaxID=562 RepID=UPI003D783700
MASVSFIWMPALNVCRTCPLSTGLGLSKTFRRLVVTLIQRYGVSLIHLDASAECLPDLPTFDW